MIIGRTYMVGGQYAYDHVRYYGAIIGRLVVFLEQEDFEVMVSLVERKGNEDMYWNINIDDLLEVNFVSNKDASSVLEVDI